MTCQTIMGEEEEMEGLTASFDNGHEDNDSENGHMDPLTLKFQELRKSTASFTAIDKNFLRPFFTKEDKCRNSTDQAPNGMEAADFEKVSSQTQGKQGGTRQSTGIPALNLDVEYGVPDMPRPWRQNSARRKLVTMLAKEVKREKRREAKALTAAVLDKVMAMSEGILETLTLL